MNKKDLVNEFLELKKASFQPEKDWDLIWVLSAGELDIAKDYKNKRNETRDRIESGIRLVKEITALRLSKNSLTFEDIKQSGPKIYFSGYNPHNRLMKKYISQSYFKNKYHFPDENILIGPQENILHTDSQFQKFPKKFIEENRKIVIVTDAYHLPRSKRYLKKYPKKFDENKFIFYPSKPLNLNIKQINLEIKKIIRYTKNKILPDIQIPEKIVILGANGFIGSHLTEKLQKLDTNFEVFSRSKHDFKKIKTLEDLISGVTTIFHLANNITESQEILNSDLANTRNLIKAVIKYAPKAKIVYISSFAVYKQPEKHEIINETFPTIPRNNYGKSKLDQENLLISESKKNNFSVISLRLSNIYGPSKKTNQHSAVAKFIEQIQKDKTVFIGSDGKQTRDYLYIEDVIAALITSIYIKNNTPLVVNICSGNSFSTNNLVRLIEQTLGKKAEVEYLKSQSGEGFWRAKNIFARKILSWKPKFSLKQGLKLSVQRSK